MYDVIIVGGGPAGLAAALTLGRSRRRTLVLDAGEGRNAPAAAVHNFLTRDGTPPAELRRVARAQLGAYPDVELRHAAVADAVRTPDGAYRVAEAGGGAVDGRRLLLATGVVDELPDVPGVAPLWGRSVLHCPYCHGFEVSGRRVAVLGAGPGHVRLALHLLHFTADVVLLAGAAPLPDGQRDLLDAHGVAVRREPVARLEGAGGRLEQVRFEGGEPLARDAVFAGGALRERSGLPEKLGCPLLPDRLVEVDEFGRTGVAGVYAAGDMAHRATVPVPVAAVVAAAAAGTVAGAALDQDLLSEEYGLPDPFPKAPAAAPAG
ncbi:NAD(P)/FAD-dependent oxidoreductase [Streptomyces sp. WMMC500]|uniref:NAD(P)/FAD-dependent oxidoreductase n=1 Tax=Streptomyces sp. WMMC500 TaxID=3015154 RepID=UPI00248CB586|nr:NAD(P)/FAD-dependent oxidoreductase [Streptomyces sp. WMMC500]WBB60563.1 NAD(P)/FAD-dependent oxidoreductase [Streptomyces sp. WMMC500]